jgi:hypothetical protein
VGFARKFHAREKVMDSEPKMTARVIVARGWSIDVPRQPTEAERITFGVEGWPSLRALTRRYTEGQEVELPVDEIAGLRARGIVVDIGQALRPGLPILELRLGRQRGL